MTVYKLSDNSIKIFLTKTEIIYGFGGYENLIFMKNDTKEKLKALIMNTVSPTIKNMSLKGKISFLKEGCIISFDAIKRKNEFSYLFKNAESLISSMLFLYKAFKFVKSDLYLFERKYYLFSEISLPVNSEILDEIEIEKAKEYGKVLALNDAICRFGKAFIKDF